MSPRRRGDPSPATAWRSREERGSARGVAALAVGVGLEDAEVADLGGEEAQLLERALDGRLVGMAFDFGIELRGVE